MARFKNKLFFFPFIFLLLCFFITTPLRTNLIDLLRLPLIFGSLILKEGKNFLSYRIILSENISLKTKLDNLQKEFVKLEEKIIENENLRNLISFKKEKEFKTILSKVIARDPSNWYSAVLIDKGKMQKVNKGDCVINQKGLVGRVSEVGNNTSKVVLITDPQFSCAAVIQRSRQQGIVYGSLLNKLIMRYFEDSVDVKIDDVVITSSLSTFAPKGILIGKITDVKSDSMGIKAEISPAVELGKLEDVLIILKNDRKN